MRATLLMLAGALAAVASTAPVAGVEPAELRTRLVDRLDRGPLSPLQSYRAMRHLEAAARHDTMHASLDAWTTLDAGALAFEVLREEGSSLIRKRVLRAALAAERDLLRSGESAGGAITTTNYDFAEATPEQDGQVRLVLRPKRQHQLLLNGTVVLDVESAEIVSVEGILSKRPSFWTRRVQVERRYARVGGMHVPVSMQSTADVRLAGRSTFEMTYCYAEINGAPVGSCPPAP